MVPPPSVPVAAPPPHPHPIYHPQQRSQQQHPSGYQQGYPPAPQPVGMSRYGPPPMHPISQHQQHARVHHHHHHHQAHTGGSNSYRHAAVSHSGAARHPPHPVPVPATGSHHHYHSHHAMMVPGAPHGMGPHHPHRHPYPPRSYHVAPSQSQGSHPPHSHASYAVVAGKLTSGSTNNNGNLRVTSNTDEKSIDKEITSFEGSTNESTLDSANSSGAAGESVKSPDPESKSFEFNQNGGAAQVLHEQSSMPSVSFKDCIVPDKNISLSSNVPKGGKVIATSKDNQNPTTVMSPITMCFTRMLGAAEAIKTPGSISNKKRGPLSKKTLPLNSSSSSVRIRRDGESNPFDEIQDDPDLERLVILQMAMQRNQHFGSGIDSAPIEVLPLPQYPKREISRVISEGFFWREYPACEQVLYNHMQKYYEISAIQKNYKVQQYFNNVLVEEVRKAAYDSGFTVDPEFCDKMLRDRIRCFYKTHLQNAKKRLATMMKHSDSLENQCLVAVFIRCARNPDLSFEDSLAMGNTKTFLDTENEQENITVPKNGNPVLLKVNSAKSESVEKKLKSILNEADGGLIDCPSVNAMQVRPMDFDNEQI